jgi:peroxiredoxin Q/BCP
MQARLLRQITAGLLLAGAGLFAVTASAIEVGNKAPEFAAPSSTGKEIKLADFAGKKNVVLFFYIGAFTNT